MARVYRPTPDEFEIFRRAANPSDGVGANWALKYLFNREFRSWQWYAHHARQPDLTVIGGTGSGKTVGTGLSLALYAMSVPYCSIMNLAPTSYQASLMFKAILAEADGKPAEKFIHKWVERPYPRIVFESSIGRSEIQFFSASDDATRIQGFEGDIMNLDEAGLILDGDSLIAMMATRLRGNIAGRQRLNRLSVITASYLEAPPWLWSRMDMIFQDPEHFLSMTVKSEDNLSEIDMENYRRRIPKELQAMLLDGKRAEGQGKHFTLKNVGACEDMAMNRWMQYHTYEKEIPTPEWKYEEVPGAGCILFEMPSEAKLGREYLLIGDPGQGNAPHRNAGVVLVFDITDFPKKPAILRCFRWVSGNGSYTPFLLAYRHCWQKYRPSAAIIDSTGTQALWNEQILFNEGIWATGMDFSGKKHHMITAAETQIDRHLFKFPFIQGMRSQLVAYDVLNDSKLAQDIAVCIMMASFWLRVKLYEDYEEDLSAEQSAPTIPSARGLPSTVRGAERVMRV